MFNNRNILLGWFYLWFAFGADLGSVEIARATWEEDMLTAIQAVQNNTSETITKVDNVAYQLNDLNNMKLPEILSAIQDCNSQLTYLAQYTITEFKPMFETMNQNIAGIAGFVYFITEILTETRTANVLLNGIYSEATYNRMATEALSDKIRNNYEGETGSIWSRLTDNGKYYSVGESSKRTMDAVESTRDMRGDGTYATRIEGDNEHLVNVHVNSIDGLNFENGGVGNTMPVTIMNPIPLPVTIDTPVEVWGNVNVQNEVSIAGSGEDYTQDNYDNGEIENAYNQSVIHMNNTQNSRTQLDNRVTQLENRSAFVDILQINIPNVTRVSRKLIEWDLTRLGLPKWEYYIELNNFEPFLSTMRTLVSWVYTMALGWMIIGIVRRGIA